jgi:hypothetical protein
LRSRSSRIRTFAIFIGGGILPGLLWVWYHVAAFGSPFALPNKFQNPQFVDVVSDTGALWGVIEVLPKCEIVWKLLFGVERGLLFTQPWVLLGICFVAWQFKNNRKREEGFTVGMMALSTFFGLLYMNSAFGGWHGGLTPGPRYLGPCLPLFSIWLGFGWGSFSKLQKALLKGCIWIAIVFSMMVYATTLGAPNEPLWPYYLEKILNKPSLTILSRVIGMIVLLLGMLWLVRRRDRSAIAGDGR